NRPRAGLRTEVCRTICPRHGSRGRPRPGRIQESVAVGDGLSGKRAWSLEKAVRQNSAYLGAYAEQFQPARSRHAESELAPSACDPADGFGHPAFRVQPPSTLEGNTAESRWHAGQHHDVGALDLD